MARYKIVLVISPIMPDKPVTVSQNINSTLVRQSRFFASLPANLQTEMAQKFRLEEWKKGNFIDPALLMTRFFTVLDGQIEMKRSNPLNGREVTLDMLYPGDSFDVVTLLDSKPHDMIMSPLTNLQLMSVPIEVMRQWLWSYPELNRQFLPYLADKMRHQENQSTNFALHDVSTRLSRIILKHINKVNAYTGHQKDAHKHHLINGLSDEVLARMAGSVRQVVNKQLQHWKSQNILDKKRNQLLINDLGALVKEAHYTESSLDNS